MCSTFKKELEGFFEKFRLVKYKKNELLYRPGDSFSLATYIKSGYVRVYAVSKNGQEVTIHIAKPFSLFPLVLDGKTKRQYYVEAVTPVEVWQAPREELLAFIDKNPSLGLALIANLGCSIGELLRRIEYLASGDAFSKVAAVLFLLANKDRARKSGEIPLEFAVTHRLIASLTGLTRETVTLQMLKLKEKGLLIGKGRRLAITNIDKLKEEFAPEED